MTLLGRFFGSRDDVPEWARFFKPQDYQAFLDALLADMERRGLAYELGEGTLRTAAPGEEPADYGLLNLAQLCNATESAEWPATIARHFDSAFGCARESAEVDARANSLEAVRPYLKVRIYHADYREQVGADRLVHRVPAEGLVETLVYDLPGSVRSVPPDHARRWGLGEAELFRIALENVRAEPRPAVQAFDVEGGAAFHALVGDSFFTASHALFLEEYLRPAPEHGAVVAVPHRHAVLYHAIRDMRVMLAIQSMIPVAFGMYQEGPGSISAGLYWWQGAGRLTHLPTHVRSTSVEFSPPDAFVREVLNRLPEG
jgi:hypothetical protein